MLPVFKLVAAHVKGAAVDLAQQYIGTADAEITLLEAHGSRTVATATTLVEEQGAEAVPEVFDHSSRCVGNTDSGNQVMIF